jgi:hypothetical protein
LSDGGFHLKCYRAADTGSTVWPFTICQRAGKSLLKFHHTRTNRLRASQNAAALLFDFGAVDIRRVGTQANTRGGVFRVKHKSSHQAFAGNDDSRPGLGRTA